ncbi:DJ-1/PfpI family protein [Rhodovarius crocodyli]|uniref:DJ-1/PfpI family protein n=1 Tax=Rhodovarius crocodyli TaxID=1979269 RepID=A0A437MMW0_9PROT|nr:DJ-1/PfpI family protein [Rhodovarius crocodyli]RVT98973.1 DJ-1/PfpI family protein [Rhodovarius crocodyli]
MLNRDDPAVIAVLLYDGVEPIDIGGTIGVISMASRVLPGIRAVAVAERAGPVACAGGLTVKADYRFDAVPDYDALIVTGGPGWQREVSNPVMLDFLRSQPAGRLASVCTGALILGAAGLLTGRAATTRRQAVGLEARSPLDLLADMGASTRPAQLVDDGPGPFTAGGVSMAIDGTLHLIGRLYGEEAQAEVARVIEYDRAFAANRAALGR